MARKHAACGSQPCPKHLQCCTAALNMPKNHPKPLLRQGKAANLGQDDEPGHAVSCSHAPTLVIQVHGSSLGAATRRVKCVQWSLERRNSSSHLLPHPGTLPASTYQKTLLELPSSSALKLIPVPKPHAHPCSHSPSSCHTT